MLKVLLVIDEFKELTALESVLKRLSFDVLSISKDVLVSDALLRFQPDIVVANYKGRAVDGLKLAARMRKSLPRLKVVLLHSEAQPLALTDESTALVDGVLSMPIEPRRAVEVLSDLGGVDGQALLQRYDKMSSAPRASADGPIAIDNQNFDNGVMRPKKLTSTQNRASWDPIRDAGTAEFARTDRSDRYDQFLLKNDEKVDGVMPADRAKAAMRAQAKASESERAELEKLTAEKREFIKAMFDDGSSSDDDEL